MATSIQQGDMHVAGTLSAQSMTLPVGCITAANIANGAAIETSKSKQQHVKVHTCGFDYNDAVAAARHVIHVVNGATGLVQRFKAGLLGHITNGGTATVNLYKNGSTILSAPITLSNSQADREVVSATISSMSVAVDDVLEVVLAVASAPDGTGFFCELVVDEDPL